MNAVKKKSVRPYPIPVSMDGLDGGIVKLTVHGFLVQTRTPLKVGQQFSSSFVIPVLGTVVQFVGVVVKTYDEFRGKLGEVEENLKLAEVGFRQLGSGQRESIDHFLAQIGQD